MTPEQADFARRSLEARLTLIACASRTTGCRERRDFDGAAYWRAETDAARIVFCRAIDRPDLADYWTDYYVDRYGMQPEPVAA